MTLKTYKFIIKPQLLYLAILIFLLLGPFIAFSQESEVLSPDEIAWRSITPKIENFWRNYQTSPTKMKDEVWPLISTLKNFIKGFPKSKRIPEAYYILGEAYAAASYWPEAEAHWRIVIRYFPNSRWTNQALNALVLYYEKIGDQKKLKRFYREVIRQFPDSIAARTAKVLMARHVLEMGKVDIARKVAEKIKKSSPFAEVEVPELLDLMARLAVIDNKPKKAIEYWLRYLNLVRSPSARASTLYQIAETYRKMGDYLKAIKYYALIRRDFSNQPEYLFAKFRMVQLEEMAKRRLAKYTRGKLRPTNYIKSELIFDEILKKFPHHPITREVKKEYVALELSKKDYLKALNLANKYLKQDKDNPYNNEIKQLAKEAKDKLIKTKYAVSKLEKIVNFGKPFLTKPPENEIESYIRQITQIKWVELQNELLKVGRPTDALKECWEYERYFKDKQELLKKTYEIAQKAIIEADKQFLDKKQYAELVNFYLFHKKEIDKLKNPLHYYFLAKAYGKIGLSDASLRAYLKSWQLIPPVELSCNILSDWCDEVFRAKRFKVAQDTFSLLNIYCPEIAMSAHILYLKSRLALWQGDYTAAFNMAKDSISLKPDSKNVIQGIKCGILLGQWNEVRDLFSRFNDLIPKEEKLLLLKKWGDEAMMLAQYKEAIFAYELLKKVAPKDDSADFRKLLAETKLKSPGKTIEEWKKMAKEAQGIWKDASKVEADFYKFSKGI